MHEYSGQNIEPFILHWCSCSMFRNTFITSTRPPSQLLSQPPLARLSVRLSIKSFSNFTEIWFVGRGQWVLHFGMPYDLIQGQGHGGPKVAKMADFKVYLLCQYARNLNTNGEFLYSKTISNFFPDRFLIIILVWCRVSFKLWVFWGVDRQSHRGLILWYIVTNINCIPYISPYQQIIHFIGTW